MSLFAASVGIVGTAVITVLEECVEPVALAALAEFVEPAALVDTVEGGQGEYREGSLNF